MWDFGAIGPSRLGDRLKKHSRRYGLRRITQDAKAKSFQNPHRTDCHSPEGRKKHLTSVFKKLFSSYGRSPGDISGLKPESINVPLRGLDPLARDGANRIPCGLARCSASKIDLHLIYGKRLELLAPGLDEDVVFGDDSVDSLDQIFLNRAHVFNRPRCTVN
jgi:hypothetical protein